MKDNGNMEIEEKKEKKSFSSVWEKTIDVSKKTADSVQKGAKSLIDQMKKNAHEKRLKKLNPIFPEDFNGENFHLPNVIQIVDDAERRDIEICAGAIGWIDKVQEVEVFHLYDEWVEQSGICFVPVWKCDNIYCVDNFDKNRYLNIDNVFSKATEEKIAELQRIAYCLGAKSCSVQIVEAESVQDNMHAQGKLKMKQGAATAETQQSSTMKKNQSGAIVNTFEGHQNPTQPTLKWFQHDDTIKSLIEMRCSDIRSIKSQVLELKGAYSATLSRKVACAIDALVGVKGSMGMEQKTMKEHSSVLIFEIEF